MIAIIFMLVLACIGVWNITDGWFSLSVHWKRDGQTFWKDHIIRWVRIFLGFVLLYMAYFFGMTIFVECPLY